MKRHILAILAAAIMALCPIQIFAGTEASVRDNEAQAQTDQAMDSAAQAAQAQTDQTVDSAAQTAQKQTYKAKDNAPQADQAEDNADQNNNAAVRQGWNEDRSIYYLEDGTAATGIFKAVTAAGKEALYYANKDGVVKTTAGWAYQGGNKYRVTKGGAIRTKEGVFKVGKYRYVIPAGAVNGAVCRKIGPVMANGTLYYVSSTKGRLGTHKAYKLNKKVYHVTSKGVVTTGKHKWKDGKYYYSLEKGCLKTSAGMVTKGTKRFYVKKGGLVRVSQKFKYKNHYYIAGKNGNVCTGIFKWNKTMYYAGSDGILMEKAGIVTVDDCKYYVAKGGEVYVDTLISAGGKKYAADSNGKLRTGLFRLGDVYYFAESDHTVLTSEKVFRHGNNYYFNKKGGGLARNEFVEHENKHYYAGDDAAFMTTQFKMKGVTFDPSKEGVLPEEEYRKLYPLDDDDDDY